MNNFDSHNRYARQILLKEFGQKAQDKLTASKVLVIGAGGLGCPALQYIAAAGVGTIGIIDFDIVELSNLHRQILYSMNDIGKSKAVTAAEKLRQLNPEINVISMNLQITNQNALEIISNYDLVIDGSDNFTTRYMINDACVISDKPLVYGAVLGFEGQTGVFNLTDPLTNIRCNYRDLFSESPETSYSCNESGVLGVLPGIIGTMQATEAIKIITGIGKPLCNKILSYNALENTFHEFCIFPHRELNKTIPADKASFRNYDYPAFCNASQNSAISIERFEELIGTEKVCIVDVRETGELPIVNEFSSLSFPLSSFKESFDGIQPGYTYILYCQSGKRSIQAVQIMKNKFPDCIAYSLEGGIVAWYSKQNNIQHEQSQ